MRTNMKLIGNRKDRRTLLLAGLVAIILFCSVIYKETNTRVKSTPMMEDTSCQTDLNTVEGMS